MTACMDTKEEYPLAVQTQKIYVDFHVFNSSVSFLALVHDSDGNGDDGVGDGDGDRKHSLIITPF